jgi:AcrR family transcriptional regulator
VPARSSTRLTRSAIVEAALDVARLTADHPSETPTGQSLGKALGVDRSAVWRHFTDKDDLLLSVADALLRDVAAAIRDVDHPENVIATTWHGVLEAFLRYPAVGAQLGDRWISGPNALFIIESLIRAFTDLGFTIKVALLHYRTFIDLTLSCASTQAQYALLSEQDRRADEITSEVAIRNLDTNDYPLLTTNVEALTRIAPSTVLELIFSNYMSGVKSAR